MEDALISPEGFMILSGACLIKASSSEKVYVHCVERVKVIDSTITLKNEAATEIDKEKCTYVMKINDNGEVASAPVEMTPTGKTIAVTDEKYTDGDIVLVDYYTEKTSGAQQIEITPDKFGGNYYLEASTLFRDTNGVDMPAEFIIPNCKIQSNFTFTMASSGDPSTFTFTLDAFPDYTRYDRTKKVLSVIQIISDEDTL
jgi:hypothetical protein